MKSPLENNEQLCEDLELHFKYNEDPCFPGFHFHDSYEVYYSISGGMQFLIEDNIYSLNPGDLFIINEHEVHRPLRNQDSNYERIVLFINPARIKELMPEHCSSLLSCFTQRNRGEYNKIDLTDTEREQFFSIVMKLKNLEAAKADFQALKEIYFLEFLLYLNRWYSTSLLTDEMDARDSINPIVKSVIDCLNDSFTTEITLEQLADKFKLNKYYLCQLFKKTTGTTINRYISARRIALAKLLLQQGHSVVETSEMCGFRNYTHFIRTFKKHCVVSPKQFAKDRD